MRLRTCPLLLAASIAAAALPQAAAAQETVLIAPPELPDYDRGRNVSVLEKSRPDYDAIGVRRGAFLIYPRVAIGAGVSDNVYLTEANKVTDIYAALSPSVYATSDWSRHQLSLAGGAALRRYLDESPRNQDEWYLNALSRADIGSSFTLTSEAQAARTQESPFAGGVVSTIAALSSYQRRTAIFRGQYTASQTRITAAYDFNHFDFEDVTFTDGTRVRQTDRDRGIHRAIGQYEYALSPSFSVYGQLSYAQTDYDRRLLNGQPNRSSNAWRLIGGVNFDLSAFMRGTIGVGYVERDYKSALYKDVSGPSIEARVEYFPTQLTTLTFNLRRVLDDSSIGGTSAFFDNQVAVRVDHELLYNLLINGYAAYAKQDYIDSPLTSDVYRFSAGARYLVSRDVHLQAQVGYGGRSQNQAAILDDVDEFTAEVGVVLQR